MENKFLFLKYFLIFSQVLTLIIFSVYLSHFFEESLDEYRPSEVIVDDFYPDDQELWTLSELSNYYYYFILHVLLM